MIKAILVDDEPIILKKLTESYDWESMGIEILCTCSDGDEAFEQICERSPDLVITDIRMPNLNGTEMIRLLHQANIYPKVIFVTGYSDFEYTREAIRLGAYDYILKPVSKDELETTVLKCVEEIKDEKHRMKNRNRETCELQLKHYFSTLSQHQRLTLTNNVNESILQHFQITAVAVNALFTVLNQDSSPTNVDDDECLALIRRLNFTLNLENYFAFSLPQTQTLIIISYRTLANAKKTDFAKANRTYMKALQEALFNNLAVDADILCCPPIKEENVYIDVETLYQQYISGTTTKQDQTSEADLNADETQRYVHDALNYIHEHYRQQIRLKDVADSVYLSESHFSTIFAKHVGMSYSKYLAKYRVDKAKAYMKQNPYAKIYEISDNVGYSDARYFSTLFKKTEGISPSEFVKHLF